MVQLYKADATAGHCSKRFALVTWSVNFKMKEMTSPDTWLVLGKFRRMCRVSFSNPTFPSQPLLKIKAGFHWCGLFSVSAFFQNSFSWQNRFAAGRTVFNFPTDEGMHVSHLRFIFRPRHELFHTVSHNKDFTV